LVGAGAALEALLGFGGVEFGVGGGEEGDFEDVGAVRADCCAGALLVKLKDEGRRWGGDDGYALTE
jgi:hypothetical protein